MKKTIAFVFLVILSALILYAISFGHIRDYNVEEMRIQTGSPREETTGGSATSGKLWRIEHKVNSLELPEYRHIARNIHRGQSLKLDKQCVSEYWIVLTTIFNVTSAILDYNDMQGWCTVIAADKKSVPSAMYNRYLKQDKVVYLDVEQQRNIFTEWNEFQTHDIIPFNHFGRKNLGYLYAMMNGAKYIYDTDDDNKVIEPFNKEGIPIFSAQLQELENVMPIKEMKKDDRIDGALTFNVFLLWSADSFIWPRGYDLALLTESLDWHRSVQLETKQSVSDEHFIVQQWLSDLEPDFDALQRLIGKNTHYEDGKSMMGFSYESAEQRQFAASIPNHLYVPFNAQMTIWDYRAFLFLYLPVSVHGRVSDIWRSYFAQTVMHILQLNGVANWKLLYCPVLVNQYRNPHDYLADFQSELPLYLQTHQLLLFLHAFAADYELRADDGRRAVDISNVNVGQILLDLYIELYEYNVVGLQDVKGIYAWIHDIVEHVAWRPNTKTAVVAPHRAPSVAFNVLYLVQGSSIFDSPHWYQALLQHHGSYMIFLYYDQAKLDMQQKETSWLLSRVNSNGEKMKLAIINGTGTSFAEGRNMLLSAVRHYEPQMLHGGKFDYVCLLDADLQIHQIDITVSNGTVQTPDTLNASNLFPLLDDFYLNFLHKYTPLIGLPHRIDRTGFRTLPFIPNEYLGSRFVATEQFDPMIAYYTRPLIDNEFLFPLESRFDVDCWWTSGHIQRFKISMLFPFEKYNASLIYLPFAVTNPAHAKYPMKCGGLGANIYPLFVQYVVKYTPFNTSDIEKIFDEKRFGEWRVRGRYRWLKQLSKTHYNHTKNEANHFLDDFITTLY